MLITIITYYMQIKWISAIVATVVVAYAIFINRNSIQFILKLVKNKKPAKA